MSEPNTTVDIMIGNPRSSSGETWVEVKISDGPSGVPLADFRMDPADWYALLHGGARHGVPAFVTTHPERIGKRYEAVGTAAPSEFRWDRKASHANIIAATEPPAGWDGYDHARVDRTNSGPRVVFMRWVERGVEQ